MNDAQPVAPTHAEPDGPGREALDILYRFVAALELTPTIAVHSTDRDGIVRFWNRSCVEVFGVPASEAIGRPLTELVSHLEREAEFRATLDMVWQTAKPAIPRDWQVRRRDQQDRWMYSTHFPILRDGQAQQVFCMEVDISQRKREEAVLLAAGANFRHLFERSADAIVLIEGRDIADANPAALALFHCQDKSQLIGRTLFELSPAAARNAVAHDGDSRFEWHYTLPDGSSFWAEVVLTSVALDHHYLSYAVLRDISARKATETTLHMAAQVFENSRDAIAVIDANHRVRAVNPAFAVITGYRADDIVGAELPNLRTDQGEPVFHQQIWDYVATHEHWEGEVWGQRKQGEEYPVWVALTAIRDSSGALSNYMAILSDITERRRAEERTRYLAEHDFLTDLPNRMLFLDRLNQALASARRKQSLVALMYIDIDRFKTINDSFGHHVGDAVLREVAARLKKSVRNVDTVSRQGGDEFLIILADIGGVDQAAHLARNVMQAVAQPLPVDHLQIALSVSIGISLYPGDGDQVDVLLRHADMAVYHAKQSGRNAFSFFSPEMNAHVVERVQMENDLRRALEHDEFELAYLPEIDIESGRTIGVEALIRWRHPQRGLLQPDQFIQVAEECGLMVPIGHWVLRQACIRARKWRDLGFPVVVAVNLSNVQFVHDSLVRNVDAALAESGLAPQFLDLEVTEAVIMQGDEATIATIGALRARGVQLTIDDFGTGYSRLSTLRRFSLSKLKIDRSFVRDILREPDGATIIPAIIAVARSLNLRVIAEGVETLEQLRFLQHHGCDEYQGFYASMATADPDLARRHPVQ